MDSFGTVFVSDNDDDGNQQTRICYVMPGGNYGYHPRGPGETHWHEEQPGVVPKILRTVLRLADRHVRLRRHAAAQEVSGPTAAHRRRAAPCSLLSPEAERRRLRRRARGHGRRAPTTGSGPPTSAWPRTAASSSPTGTTPASAATAWATSRAGGSIGWRRRGTSRACRRWIWRATRDPYCSGFAESRGALHGDGEVDKYE